MTILGANPQGIVVPPVEGVAGGGTSYGWNDGGGVHFSNSSLRGSIDPSEVSTSDLVHVWCLPSTANVGPQEIPSIHLEPVSLIQFAFVMLLILLRGYAVYMRNWFSLIIGFG